jgi:hypothetical protein
MLMITHPTAVLIKEASRTFSIKEQERERERASLENDLETESSGCYVISQYLKGLTPPQ